LHREHVEVGDVIRRNDARASPGQVFSSRNVQFHDGTKDRTQKGDQSAALRGLFKVVFFSGASIRINGGRNRGGHNYPKSKVNYTCGMHLIVMQFAYITNNSPDRDAIELRRDLRNRAIKTI